MFRFGILCLLFFAFNHLQMFGQTFAGEVVDHKGQALPGANVLWEGTQIGVSANEKGAFSIPFPPDSTAVFALTFNF